MGGYYIMIYKIQKRHITVIIFGYVPFFVRLCFYHFGRIKQIAAELLLCKLTVIEFVIESAFGEQLLVCALFNDVAVLHNKDNIAFLDC